MCPSMARSQILPSVPLLVGPGYASREKINSERTFPALRLMRLDNKVKV